MAAEDGTTSQQAKKAQNMINDAQNKVAKNEDLKRDLEALERNILKVFIFLVHY